MNGEIHAIEAVKKGINGGLFVECAGIEGKLFIPKNDPLHPIFINFVNKGPVEEYGAKEMGGASVAIHYVIEKRD